MTYPVHPAQKTFNKSAILGLNQHPLDTLDTSLQQLPAGPQIKQLLDARSNRARTAAEFLDALALVQGVSEYSRLPAPAAQESYQDLPPLQEEQQRCLNSTQVDLLQQLLALHRDNEWLVIQLLAQFDACMPEDMFYQQVTLRRRKRDNDSILLTTASEKSRWMLQLSPELMPAAKRHLRPEGLPSPVALMDWLAANPELHQTQLLEHWTDLGSALRQRYINSLRTHAHPAQLLALIESVWALGKVDPYRWELLPLIARVAQYGAQAEQEYLWQWLNENLPYKHYGLCLALSPLRGVLTRTLAHTGHLEASALQQMAASQLAHFFRLDNGKLEIILPSQYTAELKQLGVYKHDVTEESNRLDLLSELLAIAGVEQLAEVLRVSFKDCISLLGQTPDPMQWSDEVMRSCHMGGRTDDLDHWIKSFRDTHGAQYRPSEGELYQLTNHIIGPPLEPTLDKVIDYGICQGLMKSDVAEQLADNGYQLNPAASMKLVHWFCANKHVNPTCDIHFEYWAAIVNIEPQQLRDHFAWKAVEGEFSERNRRTLELAMEFKASFNEH